MVNYARLLQTFLDLIRLKADSGHEEPVVQYILPRLLQLGLIIRRGAEGRAENIVAVLPPTQGRDRCIALSAHMMLFLCLPLSDHYDGVISSSGNTILGADGAG